MIRNRIASRLFLYFSTALLLFSLVIGGVFFMLFRNHTIDMHKNELEKKAITIASNLSDAEDSGANHFMGRQRVHYGAYLNLLNEIAMTDAWIVSEQLDLLTIEHFGKPAYRYADLPEDAEAVINEAFQGKITFSESFSRLLDAPALTVGVPIAAGQKIIGVLLLHSPVKGMQETIANGFRILGISLLIALFLSIFLSYFLAVTFTDPLNKMKAAASLLSRGNYSVRTGISQEDEIGELAKTIDILSDRLYNADKENEKLDTLRSSFIANISHELKTPVTVILGSLEALCDGVVSNQDQIKNYYKQMRSESILLKRLINDLLDLSKLQNTDFQIEQQALCLADVVSDAVRSANGIANAKQVTIKTDTDYEKCNITGDYGRLRQMFLIILDNACKFTPKGGQIFVSLKDKTVCIRDQGKGIPERDLPYIFDRFYKERSEENKTGSGLGLSIAKQIADRHGAAIAVNSSKGEGTEFCFSWNGKTTR